MNEDNTNAPTTPASRDCDTAGPDSADSRQTARQYLTRYHRANAHLRFLKTARRRTYAAIREAHPIRTEARVLFVEWLRLAGCEWIESDHPFWKTVHCFLGDLSSGRKPIVGAVEMLKFIEGARLDRLAPNATVCAFLDRLEKLIHTCPEKENPSS